VDGAEVQAETLNNLDGANLTQAAHGVLETKHNNQVQDFDMEETQAQAQALDPVEAHTEVDQTPTLPPGDKAKATAGLQAAKVVEETAVDGEVELLDGDHHLVLTPTRILTAGE